MSQRCPVTGILCGCLTLCNPDAKNEPRAKTKTCLGCGELEHASLNERFDCLSKELARLRDSIEVGQVEKLNEELNRLKTFEAAVKRPFLESQALSLTKGGSFIAQRDAGKKNKAG